MTAYSSFSTISRRSDVFSTGGIVCSSQNLASDIGASILRQGGNCADAAIATAAALNVTEPSCCGIGGDVFALYYNAKTKKVTALNGSGRSPAGLSIAKVRQSGITESAIPPTSVHSVTVPGAADAWTNIHDRWGSGKLSLKECLTPAIRLAEKGYPVGAISAMQWKASEKLLKEASPSAHEMLVEGKAPEAGEIFESPTLANTFRLLGENGRDGFYSGSVAEAIVKLIQSKGGCMTMEDLASHRTEICEPISYTLQHEDLTLHECPPNGQGIVALIALGILDCLREEGKFDVEKMLPGSTEWMHACIEALRLAFADASAYVADPSKSQVPVSELLSKGYLRKRAALFDSNKAMAQYEAGQPIPSSDTVYFTAADENGDAISMIMSNYAGFGTGAIPKGCGFTLQNRGSGFYLDEGLPNSLEGGKRPFHTIIPAMVTKADGELWMSYGVMGGTMQPQGHLQVLLNLLHGNHSPQSALDAPRFNIGAKETYIHTPTAPYYNSWIALETGIPQETFDDLEKMGHKVFWIHGRKRGAFGKGQVILKETDKRTGRLVWKAGSDPRGDGCASPVM